MSGGFDANVPTRKPRTRIGRVLTELTSDAPLAEADELLEGDGPGTLSPLDGTAEARAEHEPDAHAPGSPNGIAQPSREVAVAPPPAPTSATQAVTAAPRPALVPDSTVNSPRLAAGRERVASLRERLASASRPPVATSEPKRTVATVVGVVEDLRARLDQAIQERSEMARELDEGRSALARAEAELQKERKIRTAIEAREQERIRIAEDALAEAEALASERDQVLSELSEQRRLDDEQALLLEEAEAALESRDRERATAASQIADLREQLESRALQVADLESRLKAGQSEQSRLEARCRELEEEVRELAEARQALEAIEETLNTRA